MKKDKSLKNHVYRRVGEQVQKRIDHLGIGHKMQDLPQDLWHESFKFYMNDPNRKGGPNLRIIRLHPERPSLTVTGFIFNKFVHPFENRYITVREAARLQGFPDNLEFIGSLTSTQQQVGNAVPVQLGQAVLGAITSTLQRHGAVENEILTAMSLFSGAGGLDIGAENVDINGTRIETKLCTDLWHDACLTLKGYFEDRASVIEQDLSTVQNPADFYREHTGLNTLPDIIYGGPPCQSFSQAGKQKGITDLRGSLVFDFLRCVESIQPKAFVMENVSNLKGINKGELLKDLIKSFADLGYNTDSRVLTASDFGSPQVRKRIFIVGIRKDIGNPSFPSPTHSEMSSLVELPYMSVKDAFKNLPNARVNKL
jgi:DNA (cytosine-5)-methyltransferase 1